MILLTLALVTAPLAADQAPLTPVVTVQPVITTAPLEPDPKMTPGDTDPSITQDNIKTTICIPGYTARAGIRNVPDVIKKRVIQEYYYDKVKFGKVEIDHLISLELGGSNDIKNLWPQSYVSAPYNAHLKDALENRFHALVCKGTITLKDAQHMISTGWIAGYEKYYANAN